MRDRVLPAIMLVAIIVGACQSPASPPPGTPVAQVSASPTLAPSPERTATIPTPSWTDEAWDATITATVDGLAAALISQYDGVEADVLDAWFTPDGLESAIEHDRQLRDARRHEVVIEGSIRLRAWQTVIEDRDATPPRLDLALSFLIEAPSRAVDPERGVVLERFDQRRFVGATYALRYETESGRWRVTAAAPLVASTLSLAPEPVGPPVRCPGLEPDADSSAPIASIVWCFGGDEGTLATVEQVASFERVPCGDTSARVLSTGWPIGTARDYPASFAEFVQDPKGEFATRWSLEDAYVADDTLPADAYSTGLTDGRVTIWVSPSAGDRAVWARIGDRFERWPKAGPWGVTDCN
jgi:hypothetical protein